jgi:hypothetical protein
MLNNVLSLFPASAGLSVGGKGEVVVVSVDIVDPVVEGAGEGPVKGEPEDDDAIHCQCADLGASIEGCATMIVKV